MDQEVFSVIRKNGSLPDPRRVNAAGIVTDLWEVYCDSASSQLNTLETAAIALEAGNNPEENAAAIRRVLHSLKGDSGVTGLTDIYNLCHQAEFAFEELTSTDATDMILKVKDWIAAAVACIKNGDSIEEDPDQPVQDKENHKIKTLVIDDQIVIRKHIELLLADFCDCTVATDGNKGCEIFEQALRDNEPFELITLDIEMPVMDGHETLAKIRRFEEQNGIFGLEGVKVVMTTSLKDSQHIFSAFKEGCEAYVKKIEMGKKLVEEIKKLGLKIPQTV